MPTKYALHYPNSIPISDFQSSLISDIQKKDVDPSNCLWATSVCSDEVNSMFPVLNSTFAGPGPFVMGGISGLPFTGITGLKAYLSHVPSNGFAVIIYGPHIGVTSDAEIGKVLRKNQDVNTGCCGSLIAAVNSLTTSSKIHESNMLDYQQERVLKSLKPFRQDILNSSTPIKIATELAYNNIKNELESIIDSAKLDLKGFRLYLVGGILINTDWNKPDHFDVRDKNFIML
ncbi:MAG: hypothetical protein ACPGGA_00915 [Balneolaceae bacterium]